MVKKVAGLIRNNRELLTHYLTVISGSGIGRGLSFATSLVLARLLGVSGFGVFSVFFTVMLLVWQLPTIIDVAYVRYVRADSKGDRKEYLRADVMIKSAIFVFFLLFSYPFGYGLAHLVFNKAELTLSLTAAIACGVCLSMFSTLAAIFQARERFTLFSAVNILFYAIVFVSVVSIGVWGKITLTHSRVVLIYSVTCAAVGIFGAAYLYRAVKPVFPVHLATLFKMFHFGKWLLAEQVTYVVLQRLDVLFLAKFADYREVGIYSAAVRMAMLASLMTSAASSVFMPRGCESLNSAGQLKRYLKESLTVTAGLSICIVLLVLMSPFLIRIFFGAQYAASLSATRILLFEAVCVLFYTPFSYFFYASNNTKKIFYLGLARLAVAVMSLAFFVPLFGSLGAALSLALSSLLALAVVVLWSRKIINNSTAAFQPA